MVIATRLLINFHSRKVPSMKFGICLLFGDARNAANLARRAEEAG